MSAQARHSGPGCSMISSSPVPSQAAHLQSRTGEITTSSGGLLWRSASLSRLRSDSRGETQCVR
jgi:hypothetical protein